jgi:cytochrome c-type biogenesis protein CcmE
VTPDDAAVEPDAPVLDVSPRPAAPAPRRHRGVAVLVILVLVGAAGWIIVSALGSATQYFYNADEAVAQRDELGTKTFRLQGTVVSEPDEVGADRVLFTVEFNDVQVDVDHTGAEPALFKQGIPVVAEGHWSEDGETFMSTQLRVKHSEEYKAENPDRVDPASP